jgi:hypothetical protein
VSRDYTRVVGELIEAYEDAYSQEGVYSLERAANIADSHQDIELGIRARKGLISNATFSGMADRALSRIRRAKRRGFWNGRPKRHFDVPSP